MLRPGGIVVITARPWRRDGVLIDFPAVTTTAGLEPFERDVALLAGLRASVRPQPRPQSINNAHVAAHSACANYRATGRRANDTTAACCESVGHHTQQITNSGSHVGVHVVRGGVEPPTSRFSVDRA
jgi:hypothetical protein